MRGFLDFVEEYYLMIVILLIVAASLHYLLYFMDIANDPIVTMSQDKTMIDINGVPPEYKTETTGHDILLMLLNVDAMAPYPRAIKINETPVIKIDNSYVATKMNNMAIIYNKNGTYKLSLLLDKKVIKQEYVYDQPDSPYIHFVLED